MRLDGVNVPEEHIKDGQIILNIAPAAVQNLLINNEMLEFDGRFPASPGRCLCLLKRLWAFMRGRTGKG